jgi:hypothetical protein
MRNICEVANAPQRCRHYAYAATKTKRRKRDGFTESGEERVSDVRYATRDFLAVVFFATLFGALGVAETLPGFCKTEANTSCWAASQCSSALPSLRPSATHK